MDFFINKDSVLPTLQVDLVHYDHLDYKKFYDCLQNSEIYFTMVNTDTKVTKIANAKCKLRLKSDNSCEHEEYVIVYDWKKRDTKEVGNYKGIFTINFSNDFTSELDNNPLVGELIVPIREELNIIIR